MDASSITLMQSLSTSSRFPLILRISRLISLLLLAFLFLVTIVLVPEIYFLFYTDWGLLITVIYFFLANLSYFISGLDKILCALFLVIWTSNWMITLIFWIYLAPSFTPEYLPIFTPAHTLPFLASITEYLLNKLPFIRKYYVFSFGVFFLYAGLVLGPFTLTYGTLYPGVTFTNAITYLLFIAVLIIYAVSLEIGRSVKIKYFGVDRTFNNSSAEGGRESLMVQLVNN